MTLLAPAEFDTSAREPYQLGEVTAQLQLDPQLFDMDDRIAPANITQLHITDPYVEQWPIDVREEVAATESIADSLARTRRENGYWHREPGTAYFDENGQPAQKPKRGYGDPVSRDSFFNSLGSPAICTWRSLIPSAKALGYLSDPNLYQEVTGKGKKGTTVPMDETGRQWLSLCTDAIGIRSRGTTMAQVVEEFVDQKAAQGANPNQLRWLSVACGTALPSMKAAVNANIAPELIMADYDEEAMAEVANLATEVGFNGDIQPNKVNIFNEELQEFKEKLAANGGLPDLIDAMGIFEYTSQELLGVDSAKFLGDLYDMLAPGGRLVFGQMRTDRQNPDFTMGVVSWPFIVMRTPKEFMEVIDRAGIPVKQTSLYLPADGTYTVGCINKPAA